MANPIEESFAFVLKQGRLWYSSLRHPKRVAYELVAKVGSDEERTTAVSTFWFASVFVSIVVLLPVTYDYGLKLENISFQVVALLLQYAATLTAAWCIHRSLRWHGVQSRLTDTFACFTATVIGILPILSFVALPIVARLLRILQSTKQKRLPPSESVMDIMVKLGEPTDDVFVIVSAFLLPFVASVSFVFFAILIEILVVVYEAEPWRVLRAVSFALAVLLPLLAALFNIAAVFVNYSFLT